MLQSPKVFESQLCLVLKHGAHGHVFVCHVVVSGQYGFFNAPSVTYPRNSVIEEVCFAYLQRHGQIEFPVLLLASVVKIKRAVIVLSGLEQSHILEQYHDACGLPGRICLMPVLNPFINADDILPFKIVGCMDHSQLGPEIVVSVPEGRR